MARATLLAVAVACAGLSWGSVAHGGEPAPSASPTPSATAEVAPTFTAVATPRPCPQVALPSELRVRVSGSTVGERNQTGGSCGGAAAPDSTFIYTPPISGMFVIDTIDSELDTVLTVLSQSCTGPLLACSDDAVGFQSQVTVDVAAGVPIVIIVDGFGEMAGTFQLHINPLNDIPIPCGDGSECDPFELCQCCEPGIRRCVAFPCFPGDCRDATATPMTPGAPTASPTGTAVGTTTVPVTRTGTALVTPTASRTGTRPPATRTSTPPPQRTEDTPESSPTASTTGTAFEPPTATPTADRTRKPTKTQSLCGNGALDEGEGCDDRNQFGGDGCAANCTAESERPFQFGGEESVGLVDLRTFRNLQVPLRGSATFLVGGPGDDGAIPFVLPASSVRIAPIPIPLLGCACLRMFDAQIFGTDAGFGPGNAGAGTIACGPDGQRDTSYQMMLEGAGPMRLTRSIVRSGTGPPGSFTLRALAGVSVIFDGGTCELDPTNPDKGADGLPCTDDDIVGYGLDVVELTTGSAFARVDNADSMPDATLQVGPVHGMPLDCDAVVGGGGLEAGRLAFATSPGTTVFGDFVVGGVLRLTCRGDCDQSGSVSIAELIRAVGVALDDAPVATCDAVDRNRDGTVRINELIAAVEAASNGCNSGSAVARMQPTSTATPTITPTPLPTTPVSGAVKPTFTPCRRAGDECCANADCPQQGQRPTTCQCCQDGLRHCLTDTRCIPGVCG
jgi:cysteine-rich repeat protein